MRQSSFGEDGNRNSGSTSSRNSSVDSTQGINMIRRNKGKQMMSNLSNQCLEVMAMKIDELTLYLEAKLNNQS